jgi:hypothetical protein
MFTRFVVFKGIITCLKNLSLKIQTDILAQPKSKAKNTYFILLFGALGNDRPFFRSSKYGRQRRILGIKVGRRDPEHPRSSQQRIQSNECLTDPS